MEKTVNQRVMQLKKELGLTDVQFCGKAEISTFTLHKIKSGEEVTQKIVISIVEAFNVNKDWLLTGKGKMFADPKSPAPAASIESALNGIQEMFQEQLRKKDEQIAGLMAILQKVNFLSSLSETSLRKAS